MTNSNQQDPGRLAKRTVIEEFEKNEPTVDGRQAGVTEDPQDAVTRPVAESDSEPKPENEAALEGEQTAEENEQFCAEVARRLGCDCKPEDDQAAEENEQFCAEVARRLGCDCTPRAESDDDGHEDAPRTPQAEDDEDDEDDCDDEDA
jgi:hypothetical protein